MMDRLEQEEAEARRMGVMRIEDFEKARSLRGLSCSVCDSFCLCLLDCSSLFHHLVRVFSVTCARAPIRAHVSACPWVLCRQPLVAPQVKREMGAAQLEREGVLRSMAEGEQELVLEEMAQRVQVRLHHTSQALLRRLWSALSPSRRKLKKRNDTKNVSQNFLSFEPCETIFRWRTVAIRAAARRSRKNCAWRRCLRKVRPASKSRP